MYPNGRFFQSSSSMTITIKICGKSTFLKHILNTFYIRNWIIP
jgi:hypothetical protein